MLLGSGASLDAKDKEGYASLHTAILHREERRWRSCCCCSRGSTITHLKADNGRLYMAIAHGYLAIALPLLTASADVSLRCGGELQAPVILGAAETGNVEAFKAVIGHGTDMEPTVADKNTALHFAATFDQSQLGAHAHRVWRQHRSTEWWSWDALLYAFLAT